jgi:hypothetical protein
MGFVKAKWNRIVLKINRCLQKKTLGMAVCCGAAPASCWRPSATADKSTASGMPSRNWYVFLLSAPKINSIALHVFCALRTKPT